MGKLRVSVAHPVVRDDGSPFDPLTELRGWNLETQVEGASTWTPVGGQNLPSIVEREILNVAPGTYAVRVTWTDIYGQTSDPATDSTDVPVPARPAPGGVSVVFEA